MESQTRGGSGFYQTDISVGGPNPISPSGGNVGSGRSRFWMHTDCIQQIQNGWSASGNGVKPEIGVSGGGDASGGDYTVWGSVLIR
ncbi:MAG: hypothetical protein CM1200mP24_05790 [Gammaproteobacteria bacterium]|nr:MAG: hypothetical protein CM1200mP24_05790 [Gammaproteobacteria bacterium]